MPGFETKAAPESSGTTVSSSGGGVHTCGAYIQDVEKSMGVFWISVCVSRAFHRTFYISSGVSRAVRKRSFYLGVPFSSPLSPVQCRRGGDRTLGALVPRRTKRRLAGDKTPLTNACGGARKLIQCSRPDLSREGQGVTTARACARAAGRPR